MDGPERLTDEEVIEKLNFMMAGEGWKEILFPGLTKMRNERYNVVLTQTGPLSDFARGELSILEKILDTKGFVAALAKRVEAEQELKASLEHKDKPPYTW